MVILLAISLFLLPFVTASGDEFWDDVDMIYNDLSDAEDFQASEHQLVELMPNAPQYSPLSDEEENPSKPLRPLPERYFPRFSTLHPTVVEKFKEKLIIDEGSQDITFTIMEEKLLALGKVHEWVDIHTHVVEKYPKYWAKVCVVFWDKPLEYERFACTVSRSYASYKKQRLEIRRQNRYFDYLGCRCYTYLTNCKVPLSTPETFLIHKGNGNEFFIFEENETDGRITIKGFKNGITLPNPSMFERSNKSSRAFKPKLVTMKPRDIHLFNNAITMTPNEQNVSQEELNDKLMAFEEIHEWPDLLKYNFERYSKYWAKVCVFFWGKQLVSSHRQACWIAPRLGDNRIRTLYRQDRTQYFDLLYCKCHSYVSNVRIAESSADTFFIHQSSANEFFVFEQRATDYCHYTLFIKDFKGGITLPNPDVFN